METLICQHSSVLTKDYASSPERGDIASFYFADIRSFQATTCQLLFWLGLAVIAFFPFANDLSFIFGRPNEIIIDQFGHNLIIEIRQLFFSSANEIYLSEPVALGEDLKVSVPLQGDKRKLVDLSIRNAKFFRMERFKQMKIVDPERHTSRIMSQMKTDLRLPKEPYHIECFDNSNIQGSNPVAACVVFKNGKPSKKEYRHYNIKTVQGPDDFASMEEVVYRRYKRLLEEEAPLPQLIVIDGGKGQLSSAVKSLDLLELRGKISIIGIAKR